MAVFSDATRAVMAAWAASLMACSPAPVSAEAADGATRASAVTVAAAATVRRSGVIFRPVIFMTKLSARSMSDRYRECEEIMSTSCLSSIS
jgi:hypothetical protein